MGASFLPVSGIPKGFKGPYKGRGKYHQRRNLLYSPQWGQQSSAKVLRYDFPKGSSLVWQKDVPGAWPVTDNYRAHELYQQNECRYLLPALKAKEGPVREFLLKQLDRDNSSGIGMYNVRWAKQKKTLALALSEEQKRFGDAGGRKTFCPPWIPAHLAAVVKPENMDIFRTVSQHTISRRKIKVLDRVVQQSILFTRNESFTAKYLNPFPSISENNVLIKPIRPAHVLTLNRRYRAPDVRSPVWRRRAYKHRRSANHFLLRRWALRKEEKRKAIRRGTQITLTIDGGANA